ncbi:MAG: DUF4190 domain-containing protein [Saprospiraceae bacterium]
MKKILFIIAFFAICSYNGSASISPLSSATSSPSYIIPADPLQHFSSLSMKEIQKLAGRKLTLKEKIGIKVLQWKIRKGINNGKKEVVRGKGHTAKILGIIALAALFVPLVGPFASLTCAILALVFGYSALKADPGDRQAKSGILMGWITIGLFVLALLLIIAILSTWSWGGWG